ncbi:unnamed protein product [Rhizophagus irregularis]|nr:unnamed protein product [Rhizophagus irregularis]
MYARRLPKGKIIPPKEPTNPEYIAERTNRALSTLVPGIKAVLKRNFEGLSYEEMFREAYYIALHKHGDKLYNWVIGLNEEHLDEVQKRIVSTLYAGDISSFEVHRIVEDIWKNYLFSILCIRDAVIYMDRVYCKETGKAVTFDACTNLFQSRIKDVFPIQVQERLASALLRPVHDQHGLAVQFFVNKVLDPCSVSFEDSATIHSTSLVRRNSSDVIINADIVFKNPDSGDTVCILQSVDFVIKQYITSLFCKDSLIDKIDQNRFIKRELIREDGFGLIYSAEWEERGEKVILKYVKSNPDIKKFIGRSEILITRYESIRWYLTMIILSSFTVWHKTLSINGLQ